MQFIKPIGASSSHHNHHLNHAAKETHCLVGIHVGTQLTTHDLPMTHLHASKPTTHTVTLNHPSPPPQKPSTTSNPWAPPHQTLDSRENREEKKNEREERDERGGGLEWVNWKRKKKKKKERGDESMTGVREREELIK